jgi:GTP-binding protein HflX
MPKFSSKAISEHAEVPLADDGRWEELVSRWDARRAPAPSEPEARSACFVVSIGSVRDPRVRSAQMAEIVALVQSQGGRVVGQEICHLSDPNPKTLLGSGTAQQLGGKARASGATMLVLDAELSPSQLRNLEEVAGIPICDREAIILNVFVRHARTRRAKIQVEIAQLEYLRPRIRGVGLDMDQQTGGMSKARGPGETASELLARKLDGRLEELKKALKRLEKSAHTQRRQRSECKRIVLVGYTNAGKTSLMNALTSAGLSARDMPFETLDTTSRCLTRHGGEVLISDTVGFIRSFPERLMASFESTLAEIVDATLLVVVLDASDYEKELQLRTTLELIEEMGAAHVPRFYVFNKLDVVSPVPTDDQLERLAQGQPWAAISTRDARAVAKLEEALLRAVRLDEEQLSAFVPYADSEALALIYGKCRVLDSVAENDGLVLRLVGPSSVIAKIRSALSVTP